MKRVSMSQYDESDAGTEMVRKEQTLDELNMLNRKSAGKDLSALTNQVLELILDNVKMTHMNQKLTEYCRSQGKQLENAQASYANVQAEVQDNSKQANTSSSEFTQEIKNIKLELESEKNKKKELIKLVEHERYQFERTMKENKYSSRKTNSELHEQIKSLKQQSIEKDMQLSKIKKEKIALQEDIATMTDKEKKLKSDLNEARLSQSNTMSNIMDRAMASRTSVAGMDGSYAGYVNRQKGKAIIGKVQMSNNFLSMKIGGADNIKIGKEKRKTNESQFSSGLNIPTMGAPPGRRSDGSKSFITRKSVLGLSNQQMTLVSKLSGAQIEGIDEADL